MKRFKFYIDSPSFGLQFTKYAPINWNGNGYSYERDPLYLGVTRKYIINFLRFPKTFKTLLEQIKDAEGTEAQAQLVIHEKDTSDQVFKEVFRGDIDFATWGQDDFSGSIIATDSSFNEKVTKREDMKISLTGLLSIENHVIPGFTEEGKWIVLPARDTQLTDLLSLNSSLLFTATYAIPFLLNSDESGNSQTVPDPDFPATSQGAFYVSTGNTINMTGNMIIPVTITGNISVDIKRYNSVAALQQTINLLSVVGNAGTYTISVIGFDEDMICASGDFVNLVITLTPSSGTPQTSYGSANITVKTLAEELSETNIQGVMVHEAWSRMYQIITDENDPFHSDLYGRTDSEPSSYAADGAESLAIMLNGYTMRGFILSGHPISVTPKEMFLACRARANIGLGFETIGGVKKVRVEGIDHFFGDEVILAYDNATNLKEEVFQDVMFNEIKTGYTKVAYEASQGIEEYNNKSLWATVIRTVKSVLDLVSPIRSDNAAFTECRKLSVSDFPTTDSKYDEDNFMLDLVRGANQILNGRFNTWTVDDFTPDSYDLIGGITVQKKTILGSFRCQITNASGWIKQTYAATKDDIIQFGLSYKLISETDTSLHAMGIQVVNDSADYLQPDGSWLAVSTVIIIDQAVPTKQNEVQFFDNWSLIADALPTTGNVEFRVVATGIAGFTIDNITNSSGEFQARTSEGFDLIQNSVNDEQSFNFRWTPARMLRKNGMRIRAFLEKHLNKEIVYNSSGKNSSVITRLTGETDNVVENANVVVNDLDTPLWDPYVYRCEVPVSTSTIETLDGVAPVNGELAIYQIVKVKRKPADDYFYGWILSFKVKSKRWKSRGELILLKVNQDYVNIVDNL